MKCALVAAVLAVTTQNGVPLDPEEPTNVATAIAEMELTAVTSVDRDDLDDQGAGPLRPAFARSTPTIQTQWSRWVQISQVTPSVATVVNANPTVIAHNPKPFGD